MKKHLYVCLAVISLMATACVHRQRYASATSGSALTPTSAMGTFRGLVGDLSAGRKSPVRELRLTGGPEHELVAFQVSLLGRGASTSSTAPWGPGTLGGLRVFVPRARQFPRWFIGDAYDAQTRYWVAFIVEQQNGHSPWAVALIVPYESKAKNGDPLSSVTVTAGGYARAATAAGDALAAQYAQGFATGAGPLAGDAWLRTERSMLAAARKASPKYGWKFTSTYSAYQSGGYAVRAGGGGTAGLAAFYLQESWLALSNRSKIVHEFQGSSSLDGLVSPLIAAAYKPTLAQDIRAGTRVTLRYIVECLAQTDPSGLRASTRGCVALPESVTVSH